MLRSNALKTVGKRRETIRERVSAAVSRRMPAGLDYLVATLHTDVRCRAIQPVKGGLQPHHQGHY